MDQFLFYLPFFVVFILCGSAHEFFHAWSADRLGDRTSRDLGRLTLNPLAHVDPVGSLLFPAITLYMMGFPIGWMKPVPVSQQAFRNPNRDMLVVSLAGPYANLLLGALGFIAVFVFYGMEEAVPRAVEFWILINLLLAFFNLLPIPPLDGSSIVDFIRRDRSGWYHRQGLLGMGCLYLFLLLGGFSILWNAVQETYVQMASSPVLAFSVIAALLAMGTVFLVKTRSPSEKVRVRKAPPVPLQSLYEKAVEIGSKKAKGIALTRDEEKWLAKCREEPGDGQPLCAPISFREENAFCRACPNFTRCAARLVDLKASEKREE